MNILLTGATGFVGSHMTDYIIKNTEHTIYAIRRWRSRDENIKHLFGNSRVIFLEADLLDRGSLYSAIKISQPQIIFHFAAQSFPETSFLTPIQTLQTNIIGTVNLLEELKNARDLYSIDPVIVSVSSSEVYGNPTMRELPITENTKLRAANPYSISKVGHDFMSQYYFKAYGMKVITTRMFSHEGPRRGKQFALSSFSYQIALNEKTKTEPYTIFVGNLNSLRTYAHIDDAVHAYWLAATLAKPGEVYNIGGEHTCTVGEALENLLSKSFIARSLVNVTIDQSRIRPTDITLQVPDSTKFKNDTGWKPIKTLDDITSDLLQYWRTELA